MTSVESPYELSISLNALEHLGINLYSNVPSVLSEIVANSYDGDAREVRITFDKQADKIVISDDGVGMAQDEINPRFLTVGYRRRDHQPGITKLGRRPMGRKGIGKLSLFSIANVALVETCKDGQESALIMRLADIRQEIERAGGSGIYRPEPASVDAIDFAHGTRITLTGLRKRQTIATPVALRRRIARRFAIIGPRYGFRIFVNGDEVSPADRDYYNKIQYLWTYGDQSEVVNLCKHDIQVFDRSRKVKVNDGQISITGWLATVTHSRDLKDEEGENLNRIAVFIRGKMAQDDLLSDFPERGVYASYLIGELRVEGLDTYDGPETPKDEDAATSARQRIVEDDPRYQSLKLIVGSELKFIQNEWSRLRGEAGTKIAQEIPAVKRWIEELEGPARTRAREWLGRLNRVRIDNDDERRQLIKHAVLAFEFYRLNENLAALERIDDQSVEHVISVVREFDGLEANLYGQIVQQRIRVIDALQHKVDGNALEKVIQQYLFDHLWLLDPAWERVETTKLLEQRVGQMLKDVTKTLTKAETNSRLDIAYRKTAGQHVIIELKRPERPINTSELIHQIGKYRSWMKKVLAQMRTPNEPIEFVVLLGKPPRDWSDEEGQERSAGALQQYGGRIVFYNQLLDGAQTAYADYYEKKKSVDKLSAVIRSIENYGTDVSD